MGHEAFGRWFSDELSSNKLLAQQINRSIDDIQSGLAFEKAIVGHEFELVLSSNQVSVSALSLESEVDGELSDDLDLFDDELKSDCGLIDFKDALDSWCEYIR